MRNNWVLSVSATVVFALTHGIIHEILAQDRVKLLVFKISHSHNFFLINNAIASIISLVLLNKMNQWLMHTNAIRSIYLDALGVILGTLLIYLVHYVYLRKLAAKTSSSPLVHQLYDDSNISVS